MRVEGVGPSWPFGPGVLSPLRMPFRHTRKLFSRWTRQLRVQFRARGYRPLTDFLLSKLGAQPETRTLTPRRAAAFETAASASSASRAHKLWGGKVLSCSPAGRTPRMLGQMSAVTAPADPRLALLQLGEPSRTLTAITSLGNSRLVLLDERL